MATKKPKNTEVAPELAQIARNMAENITLSQGVRNVAMSSPHAKQREFAQEMVDAILHTNAKAVTALELQLLSRDAKLLRRLLKGMLAAAEASATPNA